MKKYYWSFGISASVLSIAMSIVSFSMALLFTIELLNEGFILIPLIYILCSFFMIFFSISCLVLISFVNKQNNILIGSKLLIAINIIWFFLYLYLFIFNSIFKAAFMINLFLLIVVFIMVTFSILFIIKAIKHKGYVIFTNKYKEKYNTYNEKINTAYKLMLAGTIINSFLILPLAWLIPMTLKTKKLIYVYDESTTLGLCSMIFGNIFNFIAGLFILNNKPSDYKLLNNKSSQTIKNKNGLIYINVFEKQ